jgi:methyl coenzyme M reductase beta subunit
MVVHSNQNDLSHQRHSSPDAMPCTAAAMGLLTCCSTTYEENGLLRTMYSAAGRFMRVVRAKTKPSLLLGLVVEHDLHAKQNTKYGVLY